MYYHYIVSRITRNGNAVFLKGNIMKDDSVPYCMGQIVGNKKMNILRSRFRQGGTHICRKDIILT